ncbi:MAG TPA: 3-oxoacyl-[acyl-carrier-protein] reductase [Dehalococcoidia bacterium]|nr:3-oxoacyl-[acyl-carrier-protein] reductase [Dehalococcoidia bacterium]
MDLATRVAIVTGSGRGIGRAIALKLAQAGAAVVVNDIGDAKPPEAVVKEIKAMGKEAVAVMADVSSASDVARLVEKTLAAYKRVDILVNNAGVNRDQLLLRMSEEDWDKVLAVDLKSVFLCTKAVVRHMAKQHWGRIISLSSVVGIVGNKGQANYAAAKAGIIGFTRAIAKEVASHGVTVNAIAPGFIDTEMTRGLKEEWRRELKKIIPVGEFGSPRDVAEAVAFLASEEAQYITGQILGVDGGMAASWL